MISTRLRHTFTVARKELRATFASPVAFLFMGAFALITLFAFFTGARFFARNIADVRPLFVWLPLLLLFLVSAMTMRLWSEERKMGTHEILATLPVATRDLVMGKFLAGVAMVLLGLCLTLPLPIMVEVLGDLDWGPVIGGYSGALFLGALYVSIGLCVGARTDNMVVALIVTLGVGGALYVIGSDAVVALFSQETAEQLQRLGAGSRFESLERGVFDLRDIVYYASLCAVFLVLNVASLERDRLDVTSERGRRRALEWGAVVALVVGNALLANVWLAPVSALRADLTADRLYSLAPATHDTLNVLDEPLRIEGYFSERTHPLLAPLVPQIRDLLAEYEIAGGDHLKVTIRDPNADEALEQQVQEEYGIRSVPFQVSERTSQAVVNSYFHLVVRYGDQFEVLEFGDLIEVQFSGDEPDVRLRNLEYDLTRAIRTVSREFQSIEAVLAQLPSDGRISLYVSPDTLPEEFQDMAGWIRNAASDLAERGARLSFEEVDPSGDAALQRELMDTLAIRPLAVDLFATETFYFDVVVQVGERVERIVPRGETTEGDVQRGLEAALRRATPGQQTTVGLFTRTPQQPLMNPNLPPQFQQPPEPADYQLLQNLLEQNYDVERVSLESGEVPAHIDTMIVGKTGPLSAEQEFALDQFVMRGGTLVALAGAREVRADRNGLDASASDTALADLLETYGVQVEEAMLLDEQNAVFPIPVRQQRGGMVFQTIEMMPYPLFPDIRSDGFHDTHPALSGVPNVTMPWASPMEVDPPEGVEADILLQTSDDTWQQVGLGVEPNMQTHPDVGFGPGDQPLSSRPVAVALTGTFPSAFAERDSPLFAAAPGADADAEEREADATGRSLTSSLPGARVIVLGSAELVSDVLLTLAQQPGGEVHRGNLVLVQNLIDWSVEDTDLLEIRSAGAFARTLRPLSESERKAWEAAHIVFVGAALLALALVPAVLRRRVVPFTHSRGGAQ